MLMQINKNIYVDFSKIKCIEVLNDEYANLKFDDGSAYNLMVEALGNLRDEIEQAYIKYKDIMLRNNNE